MTLKIYQAETMAEALTQVKRELGRDAVIVETRTFRKGRLLGLFGGRAMWEVTAGPNAGAVEDAGDYAASGALEELGGKEPVRVAGAWPDASGGHRGPIGRKVDHICTMVESLLAMQEDNDAPDLPASLRDVRLRLLAQDVALGVVDEMTSQIQQRLTGTQLADTQQVRQALLEITAERFATTPPPRSERGDCGPVVVALIGPTGVGKTTTIAKLAANFKLRENKRVGLITIDTYRIAAVDQLKTYAQIIEVPLEVVLTPGELEQAVYSMGQMDVVLIDTAGRSQKDQLRLGVLGGFLSAVQFDEVHLVLSATSSASCIRDTLAKFLPLGANRIVMTKLDEAVTYGVILNVAAAANAPISYVTCGQDVPADIASAEPIRLAECIVKGQCRVAG